MAQHSYTWSSSRARNLHLQGSVGPGGDSHSNNRDKLASFQVCATAPSIRGSNVQVCSASLQPRKASLWKFVYNQPFRYPMRNRTPTQIFCAGLGLVNPIRPGEAVSSQTRSLNLMLGSQAAYWKEFRCTQHPELQESLLACPFAWMHKAGLDLVVNLSQTPPGTCWGLQSRNILFGYSRR